MATVRQLPGGTRTIEEPSSPTPPVDDLERIEGLGTELRLLLTVHPSPATTADHLALLRSALADDA